MNVNFTLEEQAAIALYAPEKGRIETIHAMSVSVFYARDEAVAALLRGALAKLNLCSNEDFASYDFIGAKNAFELT